MKKFISLVLAIAVFSTMSLAAWAADFDAENSDATVEIEVLDIVPGVPDAEIIYVPDFEFAIEVESLDEAIYDSVEDLNASMRVVTDEGFSLQVSIGEFEIDDYVTLRGFQLALTGVTATPGHGGSANGFNRTLAAGDAPQTLLTASAANANSASEATVEFDATLNVLAGTAYTVGEAQATVYWTVVPTV